MSRRRGLIKKIVREIEKEYNLLMESELTPKNIMSALRYLLVLRDEKKYYSHIPLVMAAKDNPGLRKKINMFFEDKPDL